MKNFTFIFVLFLNFLQSDNLFAQKKPQSVAVIVNLINGDSLQGTTRLQKGWVKGNFTGTSVSNKIEVKTTDSWKTKIYKPNDITGYTLVFKDGREARFFSSDHSSLVPKDLKDLFRKPTFLLYVAGKTLKDFRRFYTILISGSGPQTSSGEEVFLVKNDNEVFDFSSRGSDNEVKWRKRLWEFLAECPDLVEKIKPGLFHTYPSNLICQDYDKCVSDLKN